LWKYTYHVTRWNKFLSSTKNRKYPLNVKVKVILDPELKIRCVKLTSINSTCVISSPDPMFDHLLESSQWDDSYKWSNIGFGEEIEILEIKIRTLSGALSKDWSGYTVWQRSIYIWCSICFMLCLNLFCTPLGQIMCIWCCVFHMYIYWICFITMNINVKLCCEYLSKIWSIKYLKLHGLSFDLLHNPISRSTCNQIRCFDNYCAFHISLSRNCISRGLAT